MSSLVSCCSTFSSPGNLLIEASSAFAIVMSFKICKLLSCVSCSIKPISIWNVAALEAASILLERKDSLEHLHEAEPLDLTDRTDLAPWELGFSSLFPSIL